MNDLNDIINNFEGNNIDKKIEPDYEKTSKQKRDEFFKFIKEAADWSTQPLNILIGAILLAGATLMFLSLNLLTGNPIISILLISISEAGIIGWEFSAERTKNTKTQTEVSTWMRNWHVLTSVVLLTVNILIETITQTLSQLSLKVDGLIYAVFGIIALTALLDLVNYFKFKDNDRETQNKKEFSSEIEKLKAETARERMNALANAQRIQSAAMVQYWKDNAPVLAEISGKIDAASEIKKKFIESGLQEDEIDAVLKKFSRNSSTFVQEKSEEQPRQKRPYNKRSLETPIPAPQVFIKEETKEENFTKGEVASSEESEDGWGVV
jgi:hypothetical protein